MGAQRAGTRRIRADGPGPAPDRAGRGTINIVVSVPVPLTDAAGTAAADFAGPRSAWGAECALEEAMAAEVDFAALTVAPEAVRDDR